MGLKPLSWPASQYWDGNDGSWSSFWIRVGSARQAVRVLPSTAGQATWIVNPQGCLNVSSGRGAPADCDPSRGGIFDPGRSSSWNELGNFSLGLEANLGYNDSATFGLDTLTPGLNDDVREPNVTSQIIASIATSNFYVGTLGLGVQGTNLTNFNKPYATVLSSLKARNVVPSLSWAYTAGAPYRLKGVFGSLNLGGYDESRFEANNASFQFAPDSSRDLVVSLQSISSNAFTGSHSLVTRKLLTDPINIFIDSTISQLYLPESVCKAFEDAFGLVYNETNQVYLVSDDLHANLTDRSPNVTFSLSDSAAGSSAVDIVLPYASFDLQAQALNNSRYFPLAKAANASQYTLGRTFLQEAYIIADYERSRFQIHQARFNQDLPSKLVAINHLQSPASKLNWKQILGISVGSGAFFILMVFVLIHVIGRSKSRKFRPALPTRRPPSLYAKSFSYSSPQLCEIDEKSLRELHSTDKSEPLELHDGSSRSISEKQINELPPGFLPPELATRHTSQGSLRNQSTNQSAIFVRTSICWQTSKECVTPAALQIPGRSYSTKSKMRQNESRRTSRGTHSVIAEIYSGYSGRRTPDLTKSLPPTPISETPSSQVEPLMGDVSPEDCVKKL